MVHLLCLSGMRFSTGTQDSQASFWPSGRQVISAPKARTRDYAGLRGTTRDYAWDYAWDYKGLRARLRGRAGGASKHILATALCHVRKPPRPYQSPSKRQAAGQTTRSSGLALLVFRRGDSRFGTWACPEFGLGES